MAISNINSNIQILDEIFDSNIDNYAIKSLVSILKRDILESKKTIFLVSFREIDMDSFDNTIEVQKKKDMSKIVKDIQGGILGESLDESVDINQLFKL